MDDETLTPLLRGGHLSLAERTVRGLWPHPPLGFRALARHYLRWDLHLPGDLDGWKVVKRGRP